MLKTKGSYNIKLQHLEVCTCIDPMNANYAQWVSNITRWFPIMRNPFIITFGKVLPFALISGSFFIHKSQVATLYLFKFGAMK